MSSPTSSSSLTFGAALALLSAVLVCPETLAETHTLTYEFRADSTLPYSANCGECGWAALKSDMAGTLSIEVDELHERGSIIDLSVRHEGVYEILLGDINVEEFESHPELHFDHLIGEGGWDGVLTPTSGHSEELVLQSPPGSLSTVYGEYSIRFDNEQAVLSLYDWLGDDFTQRIKTQRIKDAVAYRVVPEPRAAWWLIPVLALWSLRPQRYF